MADYDDTPYIVIERRSGGGPAFIWGALLGAGVALLFAPRSGRETRDELRAGALRLRDRAEDAVRTVTDSVQETIGGVREEVTGRVDAAREAFEAGRTAARESRRDMDARVREVRAGTRGSEPGRRSQPTASSELEAPPRDTDTDLGV